MKRIIFNILTLTIMLFNFTALFCACEKVETTDKEALSDSKTEESNVNIDALDKDDRLTDDTEENETAVDETNNGFDNKFSDDRVLVCLTKEASEFNKIHTKEEFPNVDIESIKDLTTVTNEKAFDRDNFQQILCIYLKYPSEENVLNAVSVLKENPIVESAGPDWFLTLAGGDL